MIMLHEFLTANRAELIRRCKSKVSKRDSPPVTIPELEHGVPLFLEQLVWALRCEEESLGLDRDRAFGPSRKTPAAVEKQPHLCRAWQGAARAGLLRGSGRARLRRCSGHHRAGAGKNAPVTVDEFRTLNRPLDNAIADSVGSYGRHRDDVISAQGEQDQQKWRGALGGEARPPAGKLPRLPVLARPWWGAAVRPGAHEGLGPALHSAGQEWRSFMLTQKVEPGLSTPEWHGAILGNDSRFPRGALGLPVTYYRRADHRTNQAEFSSVVQPDGGSLRRASPVWIRPVQVGSGTWATMTQIFRCELLPGDAVVTADGDAGDKDLTIPPEQAKQAWDAWLSPTGRPQRRLPGGYYHTNGS